MKYLLSQDACQHLVEKHPPGPLRRLLDLSKRNLAGISALTVAELEAMVFQNRSSRNQAALLRFLAPLEVIGFSEGCAAFYGWLRGMAFKGRISLNLLECQIAAQALYEGRSLITLQGDRYASVPGLKIENWQKRAVTGGIQQPDVGSMWRSLRSAGRRKTKPGSSVSP